MKTWIFFLWVLSGYATDGRGLWQQYEKHCLEPSDINEHLPHLRELARECASVTELGIRDVVSTWGLLQGLAENTLGARSYVGIDLSYPPMNAAFLAHNLANEHGISFEIRLGNDFYLDIEPTDMLFIDTWHTYRHLTYELEKFSPQVRKYIAMHDTSEPWGYLDEPCYIGEIPDYPAHINSHKRGLWFAVKDFLANHPEWRLKVRHLNNHGFTVLERIRFYQSAETLHKIEDIISRKEKGVYFRFGDGDLYLANGRDDFLQRSNYILEFELQQSFGLNGPNILKSLTLHCKEFNGYEKGMCEGNHERDYEWCKEMLRLAKPVWNGEIKEVYSSTALAHSAVSNQPLCIEFLKFLKKAKVALFVGNFQVPREIQDLLFGPDCAFVPTPAENAYDEICRIESECLEKLKDREGYKIIVTAMGCSGRALQYRLWNQLEDVFLFDFGSLMDAICGWETRRWMEVKFQQMERGKFLKELEQALCDI